MCLMTKLQVLGDVFRVTLHLERPERLRLCKPVASTFYGSMSF